MSEMIKITKSGLEADVKANMTRKEMSAKYGISVNNVAKVLARAGMKGVRSNVQSFEYIDDTVEVAQFDVLTEYDPETGEVQY